MIPKRIYKGLNLGVFVALTLLILIGTAYLSYFSYNRTLDGYNWVNHSQRVLGAISQTKSKMYQTESRVRAYVILQQSEYKPDLKLAYGQIDSLVEVISDLTIDNPEQQAYKVPLDTLVAARFVIWHALVHNIFEMDLYTKDSLLLNGLRVSRAIDKVLNQMEECEYNLLATRNAKRESDGFASPLFLFGASLVSIIIVALLFYFLRKSLAESQRLQTGLERKNAELSRSNQDLEQFAYVASHDLQEPLRKLRAFGERLKIKESANLSEEGKEIVIKLDGFATKMQQLIDDLLQYSRVLNSNQEGKDVDLNLALQEAMNSLTVAIETQKAVINYPELPKVKGHLLQLVQLFQNLIGNSIKYSKQNVRPVVNISCEVVAGNTIANVRVGEGEKQFYKITLSDNGIGFSNEYAERIFAVFQRLHGKGEYSGTGIGLAITKSVVLNHGGYITARGEEGVGAVFTIYLPV
ncbi:MAG: ATP-binding protein [Chitinophagales bacterium]